MRVVRRCARAALIALSVCANIASGADEPRLADVIAEAQPKVVKIYGAGGFQGLEAYQSGFLISADGYVLTAWSYVLDTDDIGVTLHDGRKFRAKLVGADPRLEVALLKIDTLDAPFFDLAQPAAE